jgi:hypothetical protein
LLLKLIRPCQPRANDALSAEVMEQYQFWKRTSLFLMDLLNGISHIPHDIRKKKDTIIATQVFLFFRLSRNAQLEAKRSRGFHPRCCGFPDVITLERVIRYHRSAQGRYGGTGTVPSFIVPARCFFRSWQKEFTRAITADHPHQYRITCSHFLVFSCFNSYYWFF